MHPILRALRDAGWTVGVHNDYRQNGELRAFWLLTHEQKCFFVKAEGPVEREEELLEELRAKADKMIPGAVVEAELPIVRAGAGIAAEAPPSLVVESAPLDRALMSACAEKVLRRGKPIAPDRWAELEVLRYFGCLLQHVRGTRAPETHVSPKDRQNMRRLLAWLKPRDTKRLCEFVVFNWKELARRHSIRGFPTVSILYGFRQTLVHAMENGFEEEGASRTHRSKWSEEDAPAKPQKIFG